MALHTAYAYGLELHLVPTDEGGRSSSLAGGSGPANRFKYRPNWGLPGIVQPSQTGAPVLGFSHENVLPGDTVQAVIIPLAPELPEWSAVAVGTSMPMYEGKRICGTGRVLWRELTSIPLTEADEARLIARLTNQ